MGCETTSSVSQPSPVRTRRILLVDDDSSLLDVLPKMITFRLAAIIVTACDSAEAALEHIGSNGYDLVITDLNMPGMKGLTLVWAIKAKCPDIPAAH